MTVTILQPRVIVEDPHNCTDAADALTVLEAIYDPLLRRDAAGAFVPALAVSWKVSPDCRHWSFRLRAGVTFHDGTPLDAEAVIASLARMARPDMGVTLGAPGVWAQYLAGAGLAAPDPLTVEVTLAAPMADLPDLLVQGFIAAPACLADPVANPVGTGAYVFEGADADSIRARANPAHWAGPPPNPRVEWRRMERAADRLAAFEAGEAEVATRLPPTGPPPRDTIDHLAPVTLIYLMNAAEGPLADPRLRRALNLAVDREALVRDVLGGAGEPLFGPFSPLHPGHVPGTQRPDPEAARALMAEAGYPDGLTLKVDTPTALPDEAEALTAALAALLAPLGIAFDIRVLPDRTEYAHMVRRSEMRDMCVFDSSPLSTYRVLREKVDGRVRGSWWLGYSNPEVEALIDRAAATAEPAAREALYREIHGALVEDPPWLYCYCHTRRTGIRGLPPGFGMRHDAVLDVTRLPRMETS